MDCKEWKCSIIWALWWYLCYTATTNAENPLSEEELILPDGRIRGGYLTSDLGKKIYAYRGLRYAESPVNELRFKQAVPVASWNGIFDASEDGPSCPQPYGENQSEDCLRLNVYTTMLPSQNHGNPSRPVVIFIHQGGFFGYSAQSSRLGPQYLMDEDIVLVTINYRLGVLGFLSTGDSLAPGNLGLKDQVEAFRWVKKNIASFGGDPNSVTLFGFRAGSWSIGLHMLSPMSRGLFHRALMPDGGAIRQTPYPHHQLELANKQAQLVACPVDNTTAMVECLKTKNAIEIAGTLPQLFEWHDDPAVIWSPVIEPDIPGIERFLTDEPSVLMKRGEIADIPIIIGSITDGYGGIITGTVESVIKGDSAVINDLNENWETIAPISFLYERDTPRSKEISAALKEHYFNGQPIGQNNVNALAQLYCDALVGYSVHNFAKLMFEVSNSSIYFFELTFQGHYNHSYWSDTQLPFNNIRHNDFMVAFWDSKFPYVTAIDPDYLLIKTLAMMMTEFAKGSNPTTQKVADVIGTFWTPYTKEKNEYMQIDKNFYMRVFNNITSVTHWNNLFPLE